jgi:predicted TIM-barrel fold metal-dependent hydrolase
MNVNSIREAASGRFRLRRRVIGGLMASAVGGATGASGVSGAAGATPGETKTAAPSPAIAPVRMRIDVHAHYLPDAYRRAGLAAGIARPDGMPAWPAWDASTALAAMDRLGVASAVLSVSSPGVDFGNDAAARSLARAVNEAGAETVALHPARFGLFASLPLPDIGAALAEVEYALDTLHADGVVLLTNYRGIYLGDPRFDALFAELDRRQAVAFIHPTGPYCPACSGPSRPGGIDHPQLGYPLPLIEFMFETTRAVTHLVFSGTLDRYPRIRFIVPHAGAAVPVLSDRIAGMIPALGLPNAPTPDHVSALLRGLYYDLAGYAIPKMLPSLLAVADPKRILYGSDWPFTPEAVVAKLSKLIDSTPLLDGETRSLILRANAEALLPRLQMAATRGDV